MKRFIVLVAFVTALAPAAVHAQGAAAQAKPTPATATPAHDNHEYAPLQEKTVNYKDWSLKALKDGTPVDLRTLVGGKRLVMVVYFAPWCPNWRNEAPIAAKLYEKYKSQGFDVVGVSEYATLDEVSKFFGPSGPPYTIVSESSGKDAREKTAHYGYRHAAGDTRKWGSPWNLFLEPSKLTKDGEVLTEKAWVVNGELIEADVERFVQEHLAGADAANVKISPCKN